MLQKIKILFIVGDKKDRFTKMTTVTEGVREKALSDYRKKLLEHKELEARLKES